MARTKKAQKEKQLSGTARPDRTASVSGAINIQSIPKPPLNFDTAQKKLWDTVCKQLIESGILIPADLPTVEMYVTEMAMYNKAVSEFNAQPIVVMSNGVETVNPWHKVITASGNQVKSLAGILGITPRSRAQLNQYFKKNDDGANDDPLMEL